MSILRAESVTYRAGDATLVDEVSLDVQPGALLALVGPNGAGKSTLLRLLSGLLRPSQGSVTLDGRPLSSIGAKELARKRAVLAQDNQVSFAFRVDEVVAMGRAPWRGTGLAERDDEAVREALQLADVTHLAERSFLSLSGGEKARVSLARVLAQAAPIMMLDEPTAALDLRHQEDVLRVASASARSGTAVVIVVHDLSLAAAYADQVVMLDAGRIVSRGTPGHVLNAPTISDVYGIDVRVVDDAAGPIIVPVRPVRPE